MPCWVFSELKLVSQLFEDAAIGRDPGCELVERGDIPAYRLLLCVLFLAGNDRLAVVVESAWAGWAARW